MLKIKLITNRLLIGSFMTVLVLAPASPAFAEGEPPATGTDTTQGTTPPADPPAANPPPADAVPASTPPPAQQTPGPQGPTGDSAKTFHYNKDTGLWENEYYSWDPVTRQTKPKKSQGYSYNPATGRWDTTRWVYSAEKGKYVPNRYSVKAPPEGAPILVPKLSDAAGGHPSSGIEISDKSKNSGTFDLFYDASISNNLDSHAQSGDASVLFNTTGGNATSGDASAIATIMNLLQSGANLSGSGLVTFVQDIYGDVQGDIMIDPGAIAAAQATSASGSGNDFELNVSNDAQINNKIVLDAQSGDATVAGNTTAGDATTGNATAVANLVNIINSMVAGNQSFMGLINIYGNLDGDILMPPLLLESLLASNVPRATINTSQLGDNSLLANFTNNSSINNNIDLSATSGDATVAGNTTAGNATTGSANTNLTVLNLTGQQVVGKNCLLVFVNVMGSWVGLIVNAPGSTAAALGGGLTESSILPISGDTEINSTGNYEINNDITLNASSGNAAVKYNTTGGNATSGDANASLNLANIINSNLSLSDWFGVLFINVFGTWNGSFGIDTAAGTKPVAPTGGMGGGSGGGSEVKVFQFVPKSEGGFSVAPASYGGGGQSQSQDDQKTTVAAATSGPTTPVAEATGGSNALWAPFLGLCGIAMLSSLQRVRDNKGKRFMRFEVSQIIRPTFL